MAQLQWRDVAAPNFSGAMEGVDAASRLINSALNQAQGGVREYQKIQDDRLNNQFALHLLEYQDPEAYKQAVASGQVFEGYDRNRLSGSNIAAAGNRVGALLNQAQTEFQFGRDKRIDGQVQAFDKASPLIADMRTRLYAGDIAGADAIAKANPDLFKGLGARDVLSTISGNQEAQRSGLGYRRDEQSYIQDGKRFSRDEANWAIEDEAARAIQEVRQHANDPQSADQYITRRGFNPKVENLIRSSLGLGNFVTYDVGDPLLDGGLGGAGGPITVGQPQIAVAGALKEGGLSDAVVAGFMGNFHVEGGYGGAQGDGGSAGGIAQWRNERRANFQRIIGVDPTKASPKQQAQFVLWELNNPKAAGMTEAQATAIKNARSPQEAAQLIDQYYERSDGRARGGRISAAAGFAEAYLGQVKDATVRGVNRADEFGSLNEGRNADTFAATQADRRPVANIVAELKKNSFPDASTGALLDRIKSVQARAAKQGVTLTSATAADMLARSVRGRPGFLERAGTLISSGAGVGGIISAAISGTGDLGSDLATDMNAIDSMIQDAKPKRNRDGSVTSVNQDVASRNNVVAANEDLKARATAARARALNRLEQARASGRKVDVSDIIAQIARYDQILGAAQTVLDPVPQAPQVVRRAAPAWPNSPVVIPRKPSIDPGWSLRK